MAACSQYDSKVSAEAEQIIYHRFIPYTDEWFTVRVFVDKWINGSLKDDAFHEKPDPGLTLAAFELLVTTGHLEAGTDEFGARVFRRRLERP